MDVRDSFSRLKKKLKHPLTRSKRKLDSSGADAGGEGVDTIGYLPQLEPHDREGSGANVHPSTSSLAHGEKPDSM
jgi:hypothetical protein